MNKTGFKSYNYLSEADLTLLDGWNNNYPQEHQKAFKELLWKHGITGEIELVEDTHRLRTSNAIHTGKRWVGEERTDAAWLKSGAATIEAYLAASDAETQCDMRRMSRRAGSVSAVEEDDNE
jgi:hypothetical protein